MYIYDKRDNPSLNINIIYNKHLFSIKVSKPDYSKQKYPNPRFFEPSTDSTIRGLIHVLSLAFTYDLNLISVESSFWTQELGK